MTSTEADGPQFLCVGAQKAGTGWLYDQLDRHPDFWMPPVKELHFFDRRRDRARRAEKILKRARQSLEVANRRRRRKQYRRLRPRDIEFLEAFVSVRAFRPGLETYADLFRFRDGQISGDITPDYSKLGESVIARIAARFPSLKVVFIARDPVERIWSHLCMHMRKGDLAGEIDEDTVLRLIRKDFVASRSFQTDIVRRWRRFFPGDRFGLFMMDDLIADPDEFRASVLTFLGADPEKRKGRRGADFNRKKDRAKIPLPEPVRRLLARQMAGELAASATEFGGAATSWQDRYRE